MDSGAYFAGPRRFPRSTRARRAVGNAREGLSFVRLVTRTIIAANILRRTTFWGATAPPALTLAVSDC